MSAKHEPRSKFETLFNLEALAARDSGATHAERELAAHKASLLRARLGREKPVAGASALDLLGWHPKAGRDAQTLVSFGPGRARACAVARDVARASLGIEIGLRNGRDGEAELIAWIDARSAKALAKSLSELVSKIEGFWGAYLENDSRRTPADSLAFFAGLADGILGDGRPAGVVPGRSVHRKSSKKRPKKAPASREFTLHPYEAGHVAGSMARTKIELSRIHAFLGSAAQMLPD